MKPDVSSRVRALSAIALLMVSVFPTLSSAQSRRFAYQTVMTASTTGASGFQFPTALALSPDGNSLFVAQRNGKIFYGAIDGNFHITSVTEVDTIYNRDLANGGRLITGMTFGPNGDLFVSHSDIRAYDDNIDTHSGKVSRLFAPGFTLYQDVATGLPRSKADHAPNGLAFKPGTSLLYVAVGSMTNAGLASPTFHNQNEVSDPNDLYYNSAAIFQIDVSTFVPTIYATGFRNPYDLLWHSNGNLYVNDNGPNAGFGMSPIGQGFCYTANPYIDPDYPDELNLVQQGHYYGHPNPARNECTFHGGDLPIHSYSPNHTSSDGIAEYTSTAMPGLKGSILTANWGANNIVSIALTSGGTGTVAQEGILKSAGLQRPLDLAVRASDGAIFIAEYGDANTVNPALSSISVLKVQKQTALDYDGDGIADLALYLPPTPGNNDGTWYIRKSSVGAEIVPHPTGGGGGDYVISADFDGDGKTDVGLFRPSASMWYWFNSSTGFTTEGQLGPWGPSGAVPVPGDYDGDGFADLAFFLPGTSTFYIRYAWNGAQQGPITIPGGTAGDVPFVADFDGDGRLDLAVWRPTDATWYWLKSSSEFTTVDSVGPWGSTSMKFFPADYDGDGYADLAGYDTNTGIWHVRYSSTGVDHPVSVGNPALGDVPISADYDGDGRSDIGVWRSTTGYWYWYTASSNFTTLSSIGPYGSTAQVPVPRGY